MRVAFEDDSNLSRYFLVVNCTILCMAPTHTFYIYLYQILEYYCLSSWYYSILQWAHEAHMSSSGSSSDEDRIDDDVHISGPPPSPGHSWPSTDRLSHGPLVLFSFSHGLKSAE